MFQFQKITVVPYFRFCLAVAATVLLSLVNDSCGAKLPAVEKAGLDMHNEYRAKHQAGPLALDRGLSAEAKHCALYYAKNGKIDHSCVTHGAGECLYMAWEPKDHVSHTIASVQAWYEENRDYNYEAPANSTGVTGHFTQLVWKDTALLGLGVSTVEGRTVVVSKYVEQGNVLFVGNGDDGFHLYRQNVLPPK